ncbi:MULTISPECIES: hypothetical protein [unclassified Lactococcus]|uniref:hypothetical protein n=1 Tax=unclassified Lactococcus TaxID=2643510 RepID=UPI0011C83883|nr:MULTISPECIES: hypothetical protein [unclassified Lactococcus]MQW23951.1 hypothetical protein [Lactococcus sp. dk101]TXK36986.1 hypothetical protein FVP42_10245 [Lactococcus sp. dk310]TXK47611.1 hypothetical protein FVP43_09950 [Lactococcus sp. dk322]
MRLLSIRIKKETAKLAMTGAGETSIFQKDDFYNYIYLEPKGMNYDCFYNGLIDIRPYNHWQHESMIEGFSRAHTALIKEPSKQFVSFLHELRRQEIEQNTITYQQSQFERFKDKIILNHGFGSAENLTRFILLGKQEGWSYFMLTMWAVSEISVTTQGEQKTELLSNYIDISNYYFNEKEKEVLIA